MCVCVCAPLEGFALRCSAVELTAVVRSASIEAHANDAAAFHFDLACRHATRPDWLGSRYQCLAPVEKLAITGQEAIVTQEGQTVAIRPATMTATAGTTRWKFTLQLAAF